MGFIYIINCSESPKKYIGQTTLKHLCERWKVHTYMGRMYTLMKDNSELRKELNGGNSHLYNAMAFYGVDKFQIELLEEVEDDLLNDLESQYIDEFDCIKNGYNIREGGNRTEHSNETKMLISQQTKAAFEDINVITKMRKHGDKLAGLPVKCTWGLMRGKELFRVRRHPLVKDKQFFVHNYGSVEACKADIIDYITNIRNPR